MAQGFSISVIRSKQTTRHLGVDGAPFPEVRAVRIEGDGGRGWFLFRLDPLGCTIADTWHASREEAMAQAGFEYELAAEGWRADP